MTIFGDKGAIAMNFIVTFVIFGEVFVGVLLSDYYKTHIKWFNYVSRRIRGMPPVWLAQLVWAVVYYLLSYALYLFYSAHDNASTSTLDTISVLFLVNMLINKLHPFIFLKLRRTSLGLAMTTLVAATGLGMAALLARESMWVEMSLLLPYPLWCLYLFYLNIMWLLVEASVKERVLMRRRACIH